MRLKGPVIKRRPVTPEHLSSRLYEMGRPAILAVVVLVLALFGWWGYRTLHVKREDAAQLLLTNALQMLQNLPERPTAEAPTVTPETASGPQEALSLLNQVREEYPASKASEHALVEIGHILYGLGKSEEALVAYQRYLEQYPNGSWVMLAGLGRAYAMESQGQYKVAASIFRSLAERYRGQALGAEALIGAARSLEQAQEAEEALSAYRRIVEDYPGSPWARRAEVQVAYLER